MNSMFFVPLMCTAIFFLFCIVVALIIVAVNINTLNSNFVVAMKFASDVVNNVINKKASKNG